jgi:hypothetical protein
VKITKKKKIINNMFNEFFKTFFEEADELMKELDNSFEKTEKEAKKNENDNGKSYYHYVNNTYKNGKLVEHEEKEVKDGKVLKDEKTTPQIGKENNKTDDVDVTKLQLLIDEKDAKIKELENILKKYQNENNELKNKFEKVKNLFN